MRIQANMMINLDGVRKKISDQALLNGRRALANQAMADMDPFVPMKNGILRMTVSMAVDGSEIIYNAPYAKRQFYQQAYNYSTPGTGARWDLKAQSMFVSDWIKAFTEGMGL